MNTIHCPDRASKAFDALELHQAAEVPQERANNFSPRCAAEAINAVFGQRVPAGESYQFLGLKNRLKQNRAEFSECGSTDADDQTFYFEYVHRPSIHYARFGNNDAVRRLSGKESPRVNPNADRRKTGANQREKFLISYFQLAQSRDRTGALIHPELNDDRGNILMTRSSVNEALFGKCAKQLSKSQYTAAWKTLWRSEVAKVVRQTGYHGSTRWIRVDWERWYDILIAGFKKQQGPAKEPAKLFKRELSVREIERALKLLHSRPLSDQEEEKQIVRFKRLRVSDPFAERWFDIQCWVHNRPNPWFFKQPADHEIRGQAFVPVIKSACRLFFPNTAGKFRGPTFTNRTGALVKLVSAREFCSRANITARQLRYELPFINAKELGVRIERADRDLLAISLRPEDLCGVRDHIDTWKRLQPSEWNENKVVDHLAEQVVSEVIAEVNSGEKSAFLEVNRADNAAAVIRSIEIDVAIASCQFFEKSSSSGLEVASFHSCHPLRKLEQHGPVPGSGCFHSKKEVAKQESSHRDVQLATGEESTSKNVQLQIGNGQRNVTPGSRSDADRLAQFYGDDVVANDVQEKDNGFWSEPWAGWLPRECQETVEMLKQKLEPGKQFTNGMARNLRRLFQLSERWRMTPERLEDFLALIDDRGTSIPFWLRVVQVEQLLMVPTWKFALRVTRHERLESIDPGQKLSFLKELAFADLDELGMEGITIYLRFLSVEELQLFGEDPRALARRLKMQAVEEFYCDPDSFDYEELKAYGSEGAGLIEDAKTQMTYRHLQKLCQPPVFEVRQTKVHCKATVRVEAAQVGRPSEAASSEEKHLASAQVPPPVMPPARAEIPWLRLVTALQTTPAPVAEASLKKEVFGSRNLSLPPPPESPRSSQPAYSATTSVPEGIAIVLTMLHARFRFNDTPEIIKAVGRLVVADYFGEISPERLRRYFKLWDSGKLPSSCKTWRITRLLHPNFLRRVATYVENYGT